MKRFLIYILFVSFTVLVILFIMDWIYTYTYSNSIPRNKVSYVLSQENAAYDVIFLGSSRVENTVIPDIIEEKTGKSTLNLGIQGATLDDYFLMLQLFKKQRIKSEIIFIQVDYVFNRKGSSEILKSSLMPYIQDDLVSSFIKERDEDFSLLKNIPFYRYMIYDYKLGFREFISSLLNKNPRTDLSDGYNPKFGNIPSQMNYVLPEDISAENLTINAVNAFAKKNKIDIVYFMAPFCANTKNKNYSSKLKEKIPSLLDFSMHFPEERYFYNCGHLNDTGAREFSKILADEIIKFYE